MRRQQPAFTLHRSHIRKMYSVVHGSNAAKCWPMPTSVRSGVTAVRQPAPRDNEGRRATMASIATDRANYAMLEGVYAQHTSHAPVAPVAPPPVQPAAAQFPAILSATARTAEQVAVEVEQQLQLFPQSLVQCVEPEMYAALRKLLNGVQYHARAKMLIIKPRQEDRQVAVPKQRRLPGMVCVVSAGPEDQAAADQVKLLAEHLGCFVITKSQLTIRDLPGLMDKLPALQAADAIVAVAGADSSLPGAIAGLVDAPVIALPTSTSHTTGLAGLGGLVAAVSSCNLGVSAVGIDQAAAAAMMAARMLRVAAARVEKLTAATAAAAAPVAAPATPNGVSAVNNVVPTMLDSLALTPALSAAAAK